MPSKQQSEKCPFQSKFSENFVSSAQYITEIFCEHIARQKHSDLPNHFWKLNEWEKLYKNQITEVYKLLKHYSVHSILSAIRDKRSYNSYSLRGPWFIKIVKEYHYKEIQKEKLENNTKESLPIEPLGITTSEDVVVQPPFSACKTGKSNLYKLDL
jgi:hypothetical protein